MRKASTQTDLSVPNRFEVFVVSIPPGQETKLMQNCGKSTFKRTRIDRLMNVLVLCVSLQIILDFSHYPIKKLWYS